MPEQPPDYLKDFELSLGPVDRRRRHGDTPPNDVLPSELSARAYDHMKPPSGEPAALPRTWSDAKVVALTLAFALAGYAAGAGLLRKVHQDRPGPAASFAVPTDRSGARPAGGASRGGERAVGDEWQYLVVEYKPADGTTYGGPGLERWMNEFGREGWEHVSGSAYLSRHMFKRKVVKL